MDSPVKKRLVGTVPLVVLLFCWTISALAEEEIAEIGGTTVGVVPPDAWCKLEPDRVSDARVVGLLRDGMEGIGNTFVVAYADCGELKFWRSARQRTLDNYGFVAYINGYREFVYPGTNASFVSELREMMESAGQEYFDDLLNRGMEVIEDVLPMVKLGKPTNLGIIGHDETSVYQGGIMPLETEFGDPKVSVYSSATTLLRQKIVLTYLYTGYDDSQSLSRLLKDHKSWMDRLRTANESILN